MGFAMMRERTSRSKAITMPQTVRKKARVNPTEERGMAGLTRWTNVPVRQTAIKVRKRKESAMALVFFEPPERRQARKESKQSWALMRIGTFTAKEMDVMPSGSFATTSPPPIKTSVGIAIIPLFPLTVMMPKSEMITATNTKTAAKMDRVLLKPFFVSTTDII